MIFRFTSFKHNAINFVTPQQSNQFIDIKPGTFHLRRSFLGNRKPSNARHHPPRIQRNRHGVLRIRAALFAVGCMSLGGGADGFIALEAS
jgi:hypothetical protein